MNISYCLQIVGHSYNLFNMILLIYSTSFRSSNMNESHSLQLMDLDIKMIVTIYNHGYVY